jgi:hypothetical protein
MASAFSGLKNPWAHRAPNDQSDWFLPGELARILRHNNEMSLKAKTAPDQEHAMAFLDRIVAAPGPAGQHQIPTQWAGDPWNAPVLLLLMNPSWGAEPAGSFPGTLHLRHNSLATKAFNDPRLQSLLDMSARGEFHPDYPNQFLHPAWRRMDTWHPSKVFKKLHEHLRSSGLDGELAWSQLAQRVCVLELSPWTSRKWTTGCLGPTAHLAASLAERARLDPDRIVILGRGGSEWKQAGLWDVDMIEHSRGVRGNQVRISPSNFPKSWDRIVELTSRITAH